MNLNDDAYLSADEMMDQNEDDHDPDSVQDDSTNVVESRGKNRRHSKCWKHFDIIGDKFSDGTTKVVCSFVCDDFAYMFMLMLGDSKEESGIKKIKK